MIHIAGSQFVDKLTQETETPSIGGDIRCRKEKETINKFTPKCSSNER